MYLAELKLWNFRKYGNGEHLYSISNDTKPDLTVEFKPTLNVLIGENDSGKTAIIDAIKYVLNTKSLEYFRIDDKDFYEHVSSNERARELRIECKFKEFSHAEAGSFLEWIGFDSEDKYELTIWLTASKKDNGIISNIKAGQDDDGIQLDGEARENLKITYLKPLRDALSELTPGYKSRLAQILGGHSVFKSKNDPTTGKKIKHELESKAKDANELIREYFRIKDGDVDEKDGAKITREIYKNIKAISFINTAKEPKFELTDEELSDILKTLKLVTDSNKSGLGSLNKLYMAAEFLLLNQSKGRDLKLALIEELEAHLHPQAQLKVIDALQNDMNLNDGQLILTTHSTTLASKVKLNNLILCHGNDVFPMFNDQKHTKLGQGDYEFLERFLDATKANLFFARGVIMVEGDAENILIPTIAEIIDRPLHDYGVSVVNVSNAYFFRYARIFQRNDGKGLDIPVACISDLDIEMEEDEGEIKPKNKGDLKQLKEDAKKAKCELEDGISKVKVFTSPLWTLEFDILNSEKQTSKLLLRSILEAQFIKKKKDYIGLTDEDILKKKKAADKKWDDDFINDTVDLKACKVYCSYLDNNVVSKAVTAQRFAYHLVKNEQEIKSYIKTAFEFKYIRDAIYHVTKPR